MAVKSTKLNHLTCLRHKAGEQNLCTRDLEQPIRSRYANDYTKSSQNNNNTHAAHVCETGDQIRQKLR